MEILRKTLFLVVAISIQIEHLDGSYLLRRLYGDKDFCKKKWDKCMGERGGPEAKGCNNRITVKYMCVFTFPEVHIPKLPKIRLLRSDTRKWKTKEESSKIG